MKQNFLQNGKLLVNFFCCKPKRRMYFRKLWFIQVLKPFRFFISSVNSNKKFLNMSFKTSSNYIFFSDENQLYVMNMWESPKSDATIKLPENFYNLSNTYRLVVYKINAV